MAARHFAPYTPNPSRPFDHRRAAHLLRRAGFGASPDEVDEAVKRGVEETVENLLADNPQAEGNYALTLEAASTGLMNFGERDGIQAWWAYRMASSPTPLREKLTLFWHGHFATSDEKVENTSFAHNQIETLRSLALGNFRDLVMAMAKDPAMLVWLDGQTNTREHPNENFARELMELFTCGIGNYTEADVQQAARAFTGWGRDGRKFAFKVDEHDSGTKKFLGKSGHFDGGDMIDILIQQSATAKFLARKLLRFFAHPEPADDVVEEAAGALERTRLDIKWFLRELFLSEYFHSDVCYRARIASPAELVIGTLRTLKIRWPAQRTVGHLDEMGQILFVPPNVKGWDGESRWINSSTWAARTGFAEEIAVLDMLGGENAFAAGIDLESTISAEIKEPAKVVDRLAEVLFQGDLPTEARKKLAEFLVMGEENSAADQFRDDQDFRREKTRAALGVLLGLPEYQAY